jgi:hypothetical protein
MDRRRTVADVVARFRANARGYFSAYRWWLAVTVAAAMADMASTMHVMLREGAGVELHPAIRIVSAVLGPIAGPMVGKLCQLAAVVLVTIYLRRWAISIFLAVTVLYLWAAWYNVWGWQVYEPRLLRLLGW